MSFIFNMAWREMRASWHRLLLFFFCIAIGVGSIVGLRSLVQNMKYGVERQVRTFYFAADVRVGTSHPWKAETREVLGRYAGSQFVAGHTEMISTQTMALTAGDSEMPPVMVQLRGVQEQFPLYGEMRLAGGALYTHALLEGRGLLASAGLLAQLNLTVGDALKIGKHDFTIRGVLEQMPGNGLDFSPLPRVVIDFADVEATGLTGFGSRVGREWLFKTHDGQDEALVKELGRELRGMPNISWGTSRGQENYMTRLLGNWERFLGTVGLAILVLGGIGISSVSRVFVQQKLKTIAILKVLGGENRHVLGAYILQVVGLSLAGSLLGLLFASGLTLIASRYAAGRLPIQVEAGLTWQATLQGLSIGILVTLLFSLPPLLEIRKVKPILVLRQDSAGRNRRDWLRIGAALLIVPALFALAAWQSGSLKNAGIFLGCVVATTVVLNLVGTLLMRVLRRVRRLPSFALRQGVGSLYRPGNQTQVILFAVGLGALAVIAIRLHQVNVLSEYKLDLDAASADIFLIDVQKDQRAAAETSLAQLGGTQTRLIPVVQARLTGVVRSPGNPNQLSPEETRQRVGYMERLSYRPALEADEEISAGKFWEPTPAADPEVSIDERISRNLMLAVDDKLIFDLLGRRVEARVTSIRRVEKQFSPVTALTRFGIIFRPGALEDAPHMFIGATKGPPPGPARAGLQRAFVEQFPNVTMVDAFDTLAELRKRVGELSFAVSFLGGFILLSGVLILAGSVAMTKYQRLYEAAILKTLGAEKRLIVFITLIEYGVLGLLAGLIGSAAATGLTWALSRYSFRIPWHFAPSVNLLGVATTIVLVTLVGVLASWDVIRKKPLAILRVE